MLGSATAHQRGGTEDELYRSVVETMADGLVVVARHGAIKACNSSACRILGLSRSELLERFTDESWVVVDEDSVRLQPEDYPANVCLRSGRSLLGKIIGVTRGDGSICWLSVNCQPMFASAEQEPISVVVSFQDISSMLRAERERQELHVQLFQAQKMQAIGTLAGGVAHDFNNILSVIMGFAELVGDDLRAESKSAENLEEVLTACRRGKRLVQQLVTFSRTQAERRRVIEVRPVVEDALAFLSASLIKTVRLESDLVRGDGRVFADPTQIQQVVMNLCLNAAEAIGQNDGTLTVSLQNVEVDQRLATLTHGLSVGPHLALELRDTGPGMDPEVLERIFEPFFTTKPTGRGTGLGLSVVHGIVQGLGGALQVESELGRGTTFRVFMPIHQEVQDG